MTAPGINRGCAVALSALLVALALASAAHADLRPGSTRSIFASKGHLREPLPRPTATPRVVAARNGRVALVVRAKYRVSNWQGSRRVRRDRALIVVTLGRQLLRNGASPLGRIFKRTLVDHRLRQRHTHKRYRLVLSRSASRFLVGRGVLSRKPGKRRRALRLVSVRIEQDRDFKHVDGRYDWREGVAYSPADAIPGPRRGRAQASGSAHPEGTLSVTNATAAGVYCQGCLQWNTAASQPGSAAGTADSPTYAAPVAVAGAASVCFEQGAHGSNPEGFANLGADGLPQPYLSGSVIGAYDNGREALPVVDGTTVTEGITAYDGLRAPSEEENAIAATAATESLNYGLIGIKVAAGVPASVLGFAIGFPSPGAIVSVFLAGIEYLIDRSCDNAPNLLDLSAAETGGAAFSAQIQAQVEDFRYFEPESGSAAGVQLNPSTLTQGGSPLYLMPRTTEATGLADNVCDCGKYTGDNAIYIEWASYDPCGPYFGTGLDCSAAAPTSSTSVVNGDGTVDCGPGNTACDFPAAQGAPTPATSPAGGIGEATACATVLPAGTRLSAGQGASSPNGAYTLAMLTNGTLAWFDGPANALFSSTQTNLDRGSSQGPSAIRAGSYAVMQEDGNFVVYTPQGEAVFATGTSGNPGAHLALQNDGNLVVYGSGGQVLWASNTYQGPSCD